jgi:hypothetical protein
MSNQTPKHTYKEIPLFWEWDEPALAANSQIYLLVNDEPEILLCFYESYIYYHI